MLLAIGAYALHFSLERTLDREIGRVLDARTGEVAQLVVGSAEEGTRVDLSAAEGGDGTSAQVLDAQGRTVARTGPDLAVLLSAAELDRATRGPIEIRRRPAPGGDDRAVRILATPVSAGGSRFRVLVGDRLDERDEVLRHLKVLLAVGGAVGLLIASLAAYGLAAAALRPVEALRRRAAGISGREPGARLPVPPAADELHRLGATLNAMLARIDGAIAHERAFVADASHELRSPLTILKGELELAMRPGRTEQEMRDALVSAAEETDRLVALSEDLLVIARMDEGRLPVRVEQLDGAELLEAIRARFAGRSSRAGREIRVDASGPIPLRADRARLEQALGNLIENALRHGAGTITLAATVRTGIVELHVQDRGPGFPAGFSEQAFERFTRADPARGRGGAGLGLAIVAAVARAHGGEAAVAPTAVGADVYVSLPADGPPDAPE